MRFTRRKSEMDRQAIGFLAILAAFLWHARATSSGSESREPAGPRCG
jgi:hypothetical protein